MIRGIGVDLVSIPRIAEVLARHGERFARRILSPPEWSAFVAAERPERLLAKRFAAKEALAKALGTGLREPMGFQSVSIEHDALGKPALRVHGALQNYIEQRGIGAMHLSLSDEREATVAFVLLESQE